MLGLIMIKSYNYPLWCSKEKEGKREKERKRERERE